MTINPQINIDIRFIITDDAIANIRWTLMKLLPKLEYLVSHPLDDMKKKQLDAVKNKLMNDEDKEISRTMNLMNQIPNDDDLSVNLLFWNMPANYYLVPGPNSSFELHHLICVSCGFAVLC